MSQFYVFFFILFFMFVCFSWVWISSHKVFTLLSLKRQRVVKIVLKCKKKMKMLVQINQHIMVEPNIKSVY